MKIQIRQYQPSDCKALAELFYQTVHTINAKDYSEEQLHAWADGNIDLKKWNLSFLSHCTLVAEADHVIAAFGDIDDTGYFDRLFVHPDYQRLGIATALCDELERSVKAPKITTHASVTARGFFAKRGYAVVKEQQLLRNHVFLTNYVMERSLLS